MLLSTGSLQRKEIKLGYFYFSYRGVFAPACDVEAISTSRWRLEYDVYQYFLPENDFSEQSLINGIERVAKVSDMVNNGRKVSCME